MRNICAYVILTLGLLFVAPWGSEAACPPGPLRPVVLPGAKTAVLMKADLGSSAGILQWTAPTHGVVTETFDRFIYAPSSSFWDLGVDSMVITTLGRNDLPKTVQWVAGSQKGEPSIEDFENPGHLNWNFDQFDPSAISDLAKLSGDYGLRFTTTSYGGEATVELTGPNGNGATAGGGATASWHPPGGGGGSNGTCGGPGDSCPLGIWYRFLTANGGPQGMAEHSVYFKEDGDLVLVGISPGDSLLPGADPVAKTPVTREAHVLELLQWPSGELRTGGAALWIDGRHVLEIETPSSSLKAESTISTFTWNEVPATPSAVGSHLAHSFDNLSIFETVGQARFDCLMLDGFESGAPDPAWVPYNGGNLSVLQGAALAGKAGLDVHLADLGSSTGGLLQLPVVGRNRHGLKLRFHPNAPEFEAGATLNLALGFQATSAPRPFLAVLKRGTSGGLVVQIQSRDDLGALRSTVVPISDAPHVLELDWQRSTTTHVPTGYLRAWIDGALVAEHLNLANDSLFLSEIRVGALGGLGMAKGHVFVDQIEAWAEVPPPVFP